MKKAKSPAYDTKENDHRSSNNSPLFTPEGPRSPSHLFSRFTSKPINHGGQQRAMVKDTSKGTARVPKKDLAAPAHHIWKPTDFEKAKASVSAFKRSFRGEKSDISLKSSVRVKEGVTSERHSTEFHQPDQFHSNHRAPGPFRVPEITPFDDKCPGDSQKARGLPLNFGMGEFQQLMGSSAANSRHLLPSEKSTKRTVSNNPSFTEHQPEPPSPLDDFLDKIDRKFASLRQIFGSDNKTLNQRQFSFFLSKLGWISELDKNFEVQREEDGRLVELLFAGVSADGQEALFPVVRRFLATLAALFENKLVPRVYEQKEKVLSTRLTDLSNKKVELGSGEKPLGQLEADVPKKLSVARVQSCSATPSQLSKFSTKFESLTKPIVFPTCENDMQFSFRKTSDQKLPPLPEPEMNSPGPLGLDYVDASQLHSLRKPNPVFLQSEEKESSPGALFRQNPGTPSLLPPDQKSSFDLGMSICESRVIENDVDAAIERNFQPPGPALPVRAPLCELTIKIDSQCEIVRLFEGDDLHKIAKDFVTKWRVPDKELLVLEGLMDAYQAHLPQPK